jgi:peptidoglycan/LPS O-acetylase OafA/YrhL
MINSGRYTQSIGFTLLAVLYSSLLLFAYRGSGGGGRALRTLRSPWLTRVGRYSYGIYGYHVPLFLVTQHLLYSRFPTFNTNPWLGLAYVLADAALTFLVAAVSYEFMEKRFLTYKTCFAATTP